MATTPEDADALFDIGTPAPSAPAAPRQATAPGIPGLPTIHLENRREHRVKVSWPARVQLPNGRVVELRVRDLSESGVGLLTPVTIPPAATLPFAMGVPGLDDPTRLTPVSGTLRSAYSVVQGPEIHCGGTWVQLPDDGRELIDKWLRKLKR